MVFWNQYTPKTGIEATRRLAYEICRRWSIPKGGDVEPLMELFHEDATLQAMAQDDLSPGIGWKRNKQEFREFIHAGTRDNTYKVTLNGLTAEEDRVAVECSSDMDINGHQYRNGYHWVFELREGRIAHARFYFDSLLGVTAKQWMAESAQVDETVKSRL